MSNSGDKDAIGRAGLPSARPWVLQMNNWKAIRRRTIKLSGQTQHELSCSLYYDDN